MFWICRVGNSDYRQALQWQLELRGKRLKGEIPDLLVLTSHPPVYTLGKRDCEEDFVSPLEEIREEGIQIVKTSRGGRITYHGPGQIVGYFIADLRSLRLSIPQFVRSIEEILIRTLRSFGLETDRDPDYPGVWLGRKKLAAIGLHIDRGVSIHGFALNVNPDLNHYRHIVPCGIRGREVSSMEAELGRAIDRTAVERLIERNLEEVFGVDLQEADLSLRPSDR